MLVLVYNQPWGMRLEVHQFFKRPLEQSIYSGRPLEQSSGRPLLNYVYDKKDVEYKFQTALIAEPLVPAAGPARCG